jgi:hypothetical protein
MEELTPRERDWLRKLIHPSSAEEFHSALQEANERRRARRERDLGITKQELSQVDQLVWRLLGTARPQATPIVLDLAASPVDAEDIQPDSAWKRAKLQTITSSQDGLPVVAEYRESLHGYELRAYLSNRTWQETWLAVEWDGAPGESALRSSTPNWETQPCPVVLRSADKPNALAETNRAWVRGVTPTQTTLFVILIEW